jgi:hypothetical protein
MCHGCVSCVMARVAFPACSLRAGQAEVGVPPHLAVTPAWLDSTLAALAEANAPAQAAAAARRRRPPSAAAAAAAACGVAAAQASAAGGGGAGPVRRAGLGGEVAGRPEPHEPGTAQEGQAAAPGPGSEEGSAEGSAQGAGPLAGSPTDPLPAAAAPPPGSATPEPGPAPAAAAADAASGALASAAPHAAEPAAPPATPPATPPAAPPASPAAPPTGPRGSFALPAASLSGLGVLLALATAVANSGREGVRRAAGAQPEDLLAPPSPSVSGGGLAAGALGRLVDGAVGWGGPGQGAGRSPSLLLHAGAGLSLTASVSGRGVPAVQGGAACGGRLPAR